MWPHVRIQESRGHLPGEDGLPLGGRRHGDVPGRLHGDARGVRGRDDILESQQWVVLPGRLLVEDVQTGAGDVAALERRQQRGLVVDRSARRGDEEGCPLHRSELIDADETLRLRGQRTRHLDEIGMLDQFGQSHPSYPASLRSHVVEVGIERQDLHTERRAQLHQTAADRAQSDHTQRLAEKLTALQSQPISQRTASQRPVRDRDPLRQIEHEAQRVLGDGFGTGPGIVAHRDAGTGARLDVDDVVARTRRAHRKQIPASLD